MLFTFGLRVESSLRGDAMIVVFLREDTGFEAFGKEVLFE